MAIDGSLKFDTKIDTNGFNKGVGGIKQSCNSMMNSVKKLGTAIGIAFGIGAIIQLSRASIKASNEIENAMIGLKSIVEGQGRDFQQANKFIQEYISDGLIPATQAVTAYKNLAMRGYTDVQIEQTLTALKDSAAFGRQASLSLGQAVSSATEGLKNENSILVDNAGVTKNVSMMWKDYAKSIGVGVDSLTKQQKIQAEVLGIMEETRFQTGDAAKVADTYSGSILKLQFVLNDMKIAFGNFLKPILSAVIPTISFLITQFTRFFNVLAQISALLFGKKVFAADQAKEQEKATGGTAENETALGKAADKTNKKLKEQTSGLDEINTLSQEVADGSGGIDIGSVGSENQTTDNSNELGGNIEISPKVQEFVDKIKVILEPLQDISFDNLVKSFDSLKKAVEPLTTTIFAGLKWAWDEIFVPLSKWVIEDYLPKWLNLFSSQIVFLNTALEVFAPLGQALWNNFLQPIAAWTGGKIIDWLTFLTEQFDKISTWLSENKTLFDDLANTVGQVTARIWEFVEPIADTVWETFKGIIKTIVDVVLDLAKSFTETSNKIGEAWLAVTGFLDAIGVLDLIQAAIQTLITNIGNSFSMIVQIIGNVIDMIIKNIGFFMDFITAVFTGDWEAAWQAISSIFSNIFDTIGKIFTNIWTFISKAFETFSKNFKGVWEGLWKGIGNFFIGIWNGVIDAFEGAINWIIGGINQVLDAINSVTGFASGLLEKVGINIELNIPSIPNVSFGRIPALARGAVIPPNKQFMAVLGDQKHGTNIEAPLDTILQAFNMANANNQNNALLEKMIDLLGGILAKDTTVNIDGNEIGRTADNWKNNRGFNTSKGAFSNAY